MGELLTSQQVLDLCRKPFPAHPESATGILTALFEKRTYLHQREVPHNWLTSYMGVFGMANFEGISRRLTGSVFLGRENSDNPRQNRQCLYFFPCDTESLRQLSLGELMDGGRSNSRYFAAFVLAVGDVSRYDECLMREIIADPTGAHKVLIAELPRPWSTSVDQSYKILRKAITAEVQTLLNT